MALVQVVTFFSSRSEAEDTQNTRDMALLRPIFTAVRKILKLFQVGFSQLNPLLYNQQETEVRCAFHCSFSLLLDTSLFQRRRGSGKNKIPTKLHFTDT